MSHGLFVSNRSGSLNRSLFHCYRSQRELDASRSCISLSFSASRFVDKNPRSTSIHPSVCILAVVHRPAYFSSFSSSPPLVTLAPSLTSFTSRWRKRRRASIVHHPPHACMHACMHACTSLAARAVQLLRGYNLIYIVRQSPPGQTGHSSYCHN